MSDRAEPFSQRFLTKAFERAQAAQARSDQRKVQLLLNAAQCPEFFAMRSLDDARQFRAELAMAERSGAIRLVPAKRKASPMDVRAIIVTDVGALALRLELDVRADQLASAREQLAPHVEAFPVLEAALERWRIGKMVRGSTPSATTVQALLDAITVHQARRDRSDDVLLRRESARLFSDSKRIEALARWLDVLAEDELTPSGLTRHQIFAGLGLHKEPQPFLIAADAFVDNGTIESRLFRPFHGLPATAVRSFRFDPAPSCVLTVENLATFHEMAALATGTHATVVYTGGMPSPAWKHAYRVLLDCVSTHVPLYHFGDIDVGGFRIAHAVAEVGAKIGRSLQPWRMDPEALVLEGYELYPAKTAQVAAMRRWCDRLAWTALSDSISRAPGMLEQEVIAPVLPVCDERRA